MDSYIVDASVVVKWLNQDRELSTRQAFSLLRGARHGNYTLLSSDLLIHEVLNVLIRSKRMAGVELAEAIETLFLLPYNAVPTTKDLATTAGQIAEKYGMTFYDAIYVALAYTKKSPLVTGNLKDQDKFPEVAVVNIANWSEI